jgi:chitin disaccharide deacetylase
MKRLIVNADDFGRTPGVNAGTLDAHLYGIVTSATVMILERSAAEGVRRILDMAPRLSLGLHFAITGGGTPASAPSSVPTLAPGGKFVAGAEELPGELPAEEVRRELSAQIAVFEAIAGRPPSHIDSHHHSALHASVLPVFAAVALERGLPVRGANAISREWLRQSGLRVPDEFLESFYAERATRDHLRTLIENLQDGVSELMCHPGHPDEELLRVSDYAKEREREVQILCDPEIPNWLDRHGVELIGFDRI